MENILITGSNGQLGTEFKSLANSFPEFVFTFTDRSDFDIAALDSVKEFIQKGAFTIIINCAAYTAVDKAEAEKDMAYSINGKATGNLALAAKEFNIKFVHVSTDFVFDGSIARPLIENDEVNPLNVYGSSKLEGEKLAFEKNRDSLVIRTSWVYSSFGNNFVKTIIRLCKERESLNIIYDQIGTPTYAKDLASAILNIVGGKEWVPGIYHYSNEGVASWYDFAIAIRDIYGLKTNILPIETSQYPTPATRPKYSVLNKKKIKDTFKLGIPYWRDSLSLCLELLK